MAKLHVRHMVGGRSARRDERADLPLRVPRTSRRAHGVPRPARRPLEHQPVPLPQPRRRLRPGAGGLRGAAGRSDPVRRVPRRRWAIRTSANATIRPTACSCRKDRRRATAGAPRAPGSSLLTARVSAFATELGHFCGFTAAIAAVFAVLASVMDAALANRMGTLGVWLGHGWFLRPREPLSGIQASGRRSTRRTPAARSGRGAGMRRSGPGAGVARNWRRAVLKYVHVDRYSPAIVLWPLRATVVARCPRVVRSWTLDRQWFLGPER